MKIGRSRFENLLDPKQAIFMLNWHHHLSYEIAEGRIWGEGDAGAYQPLRDPELCLSFARLAARGEPSEKKIKRWVERYGLLVREDRGVGVDRWSMSVEDFREEARCARQLLILYADIQKRDYRSIRARWLGDGEHRVPKWRRNIVDEHFRAFQEDDFCRKVHESSSDEDLLELGVDALEHCLEQLVSGVRLSFETQLSSKEMPHPANYGSYRPVRSWKCPDLRSAIYLQFYLMITGSRPVRVCGHPTCRTPFPVTRKDKRYCDDTAAARVLGITVDT